MQARNNPRRNYKSHFDFEGFLASVDAERIKRGLSWRKVAEATEISPSSLTRFAQGKRLDIDGLIAMATWADLDLERFSRGERSESEVEDTMKEMAALLRGDPNLSPEDARHLEGLIRASYEHLSDRTDDG